jgi:hypothetical protein
MGDRGVWHGICNSKRRTKKNENIFKILLAMADIFCTMEASSKASKGKRN